jgi:hypothetical protein
MQRCWSSFCKRLAILLGLASLLQVQPLVAQQVKVASANATTVWQYSAPGAPCAANDFSDVPARPFLVGQFGQTVLWFAANSAGSYASVGVGSSPDILASLQRGTALGRGCVSWLPLLTDAGSTPTNYNSALWMVVPFALDGRNVQALVHNEFHGEWSGNASYCWQQTPNKIYLPCNYWNLVSASASDGGQSFQLSQQPASPGTNVPAIALGQPYASPPKNPPPTNLPQGMTAQSNILQVGRYYYVLAQQLPFQPAGSPTSPQNGVCLYRAAVPILPSALTWQGWGGSSYNVAVTTRYPATGAVPLCQPVLYSAFRFSWSFNTFLNQLIIIGQETNTEMAQRGVSTSGCPYAPKVTAADSAFVYLTASLGPAGELVLPNRPESCLLQINSIGNWINNNSTTGQAYPSLLDPMSPSLVRGDRNFQYSGVSPWLYFTQLNPVGAGNRNGFDRDVVRLPLLVSQGTASR